ncbi:methyl-accepting chemotaxis protein [Brasilonema octagenarum]|uniref:Chemotaxis protein n=1 Tax=Brasilonema octagenarum UFV-OR1 TaxID=417115 RepID=A0ABX1M8B6_9CYAN|nr:methyl-accepting chemotaxis protein [Brasilonema octagenarum]NMF64804.1 chemotaxis protein [Brasilonema octagenarum UFV-OR1]
MLNNRRYDERNLAPSRKLDCTCIVKVIRKSIVLKVTALAITIGTLPLLAVRTTPHNFGNQSISQEITEVQQTKTSAIANEVPQAILEDDQKIQIAAYLLILLNPLVRHNTFEQQQAVLNRYIIDSAYQFTNYVVWKTPRVLPNLNSEVIFAVNKVTTSANQQDSFLSMLLWIGMIGALVVAIAVFLVQWCISPILNTTNVLRKPGSGEPQIDAEEDELASLGPAINLMAEKLKILVTEQAEHSSRQEAEVKRTQIFTEITLRIRQFLKQQDILQTTVEEIRNLLATERVVVYRFNDVGSGNIVSESIAAGWAKMIDTQMNDPCLSEHYIQHYKNGRVRAIDNIYQAGFTVCHIKTLEKFAVKASLIAPVFQGKQLISLLVAHECKKPRAWQEWEINLFAQLAIQVGFALDQATLLEQVEAVSQDQRQQKEALEKKLIQMINSIEAASNGDLTVRAEVSAGEIGTIADFFNSIIENLRQIVTAVKKAAEQVNVSVGENSNATQQLASEALEQAQEITRTVAEINQMSLSIQAVADSAHQAAEVAEIASDIATEGEVAMDRTVKSILNLQHTVTQTADKVNRLGQSSQQISKVVSLINQIALQTNLLSINASLEISRAGHENRGLSVVADEIGQLAAQSAQATLEIQQILENIQVETNDVVKAMEFGRSEVLEGANLVKDAKLSLAKISQVSRQIDQLLQLISNTTISQAQTSSTVAILMSDIAKVSERTSDFSYNVSGSLQKTLEVAQELQKSVGVFKIGEQN